MNDIAELGWHPRCDLVEARQRPGEHAREELRLGVCLEGASPGAELPEDQAGCVYIAPRRRRLVTRDLFGSHVRQLAFELPLARGLKANVRERDAEVDDAPHTVDTDEHVLGRDVAMHDAERLALRPA